MLTFLQEREKSLFTKSHIRLFVDEQATRENVTKAIRDDLKPAGKDDIVIIYVVWSRQRLILSEPTNIIF